MALQPVTAFAETPDQKSEAEESKESKTDAFDTASNSVENAHDAFVGESAPAATPEVSSDAPAATPEVANDAPAAEPVAPFSEVADAQVPAEEGQNPVQDAKTETQGYKDTVDAIDSANESLDLSAESGDLQDAIDKLDEGATALDDADQAVQDAQTSNNETKNSINEYNENMDKAEEILSTGKAVEGEDQAHQVGQFTDADNDASSASGKFDGIVTDANKVASDMNDVKDSADKYDASADVDGSTFNAIKNEYDAAKEVLDGLDQRLQEATEEYDAADKNYQDAKDASEAAGAAYQKALAAYNAIVGTTDEDGNVLTEGSEATTNKKIALAKENLAKAQKALDEAKLTEEDLKLLQNAAEDKVNDAKSNLEAAKEAVDNKLQAMQNEGLQSIINLQAQIEKLEDGEEKNAKETELQKMFIEYYLLTQDKNVANVQFSNGTVQFESISGLELARDAFGNLIIDEAGNYYYVKSYDDEGNPNLEVVPSAFKVTYNLKDENGNLIEGEDGQLVSESVYYSVNAQDGVLTVINENRIATESEKTLVEGTTAHYTKDGRDVDLPANLPAGATKENEEDNSVLVMNGNKLADITKDIGQAPATGVIKVDAESDTNFVENESLRETNTSEVNGVRTTVVTRVYEKKTVTETTAKGESTESYAYGKHNVVTVPEVVEYPCTQEGYRDWLKAIEEHKNEDGFKAEFYDYDIKWFGIIPVRITGGMKDIKDMTGWDHLSYNFDIIASWLAGSKPFTVSYQKVVSQEKSEEKEGFIKTTTDNYSVTKTENVEYFTVTKTTVETPVYKTETSSRTIKNDEEQEPTQTGDYRESRNYWEDSSKKNIGSDSWNEAKSALDAKLEDLNNDKGYETKPVVSSIKDGNVETITTTKNVYRYVGEVYWYQYKNQKGWSYKYHWEWVPVKTVVEKTTTTTNVVDHTVTTESEDISKKAFREPVNTPLDPISVVSKKEFYGADTYKYVEGTDPVTGKYYTISNNNSNWGSSASADYISAINNQKAADQALKDAQDAYDRAEIAYDNAQEALNKAKADVNNLEAAVAGKGQLANAQQRLRDAETALGTAEQNKKAAETALEEAGKKKQAAENAVADAKTAYSLTKTSYDKAEADKKAADDARNAATADDNTTSTGGDDTTTGGDDTTTGGGDDTAPAATFIAAAPAAQVVTPLVADDGAAVLGEVRRTASRNSSSKSASSTDTVAIDNSNGNGNGDNQTVAGAQKEETKTPETQKEETKIEDGDVALQATPELEEKSFPWWWLLILAALAGVSVEEYARRKSNKAKAEAKDSTKINK